MSPLSRKKILQIVQTAQKNGKRPDLSGAHLSQTDLSGANLSQVYFIGADLSQANLSRANLSGAHLSRANLCRANLRRANLGETYLSKANLGQANLIGAHLSRANLIGANLSGAQLSGAHLSQTNFSGAALSGADLSRADLSQAALIWADLSQADLSQADLSQADLIEADLSGANLSGADLSQMDLFRADLSGANLSGANLIGADLSQANLSRANLRQTNISRAKLSEVDFTRAVMGLTFLGDVDLTVVKGLASVVHRGPSTIGTDTLSRSRGQIPEVFLRGCGLSDVQIEAAKLNNPSLAFDQTTAITYRIHELLAEPATHACFISYARQDEAFAQQLHDDLQQMGIRCWCTPQDMKSSDAMIGSAIDRSMRHHDKLLLILSEFSINSRWVQNEIETAFEEEDTRGETVLIAVQLDETVMETDQAWAGDVRRSRPIGDFTRWQEHDAYQKSFRQLLHDLKNGSPIAD